MLDIASGLAAATQVHLSELYQQQGYEHGPMAGVHAMSPTIAECLENARECEWYAAHTDNEDDRQFLLRKRRDWMRLAGKKELEIRVSARIAA